MAPKLELYSEWPAVTAPIGPNWGVGRGVRFLGLPGRLKDEEVVVVRANYGEQGSEVNWRGIHKSVITGSSDEATARIRSINYDPLFIPAFPDTRLPQWNVLPYGSWYGGRVPSAKKSATFGAQQTVAVYGAQMNFKSPEVASIAEASLTSG